MSSPRAAVQENGRNEGESFGQSTNFARQVITEHKKFCIYLFIYFRCYPDSFIGESLVNLQFGA